MGRTELQLEVAELRGGADDGEAVNDVMVVHRSTDWWRAAIELEYAWVFVRATEARLGRRGVDGVHARAAAARQQGENQASAPTPRAGIGTHGTIGWHWASHKLPVWPSSGPLSHSSPNRLSTWLSPQ